jgi:hypothetical protein
VAEATADWSKQHIEAIGKLHSSPNIIQEVKSRTNYRVCAKNEEIRNTLYIMLL